GVAAMISADISRTPFPLSVSELQVQVAADDAEHAKQIIDSHRDESTAPEGRPFGAELGPLEERIGYRFRDRGLLEHALTHRSRVHEDASGGVFDNESMEFLGDSRLSDIIQEHGHLTSGELRERILREIESFVGGADQHDDMTMILLKVEQSFMPVAV
ncbi:MAG TPA: SpoIIE family protein phosphatase, partial [Vicinamibacterales bacterium]|nr:SpoIIE family protein phosphatase [Vicinamibacterales bacterium]